MRLLAAGALILNQQKQILAVNPTYKAGWEIPGGIVEAGESPLVGCQRELIEELSLSLPIGNLLSVVYRQNEPAKESLQFIFDGGVLSPQQIEQIKLPAEELSEYKFIDLAEIDQYFTETLAKRVKHAWLCLGVGKDTYADYQVL